MTASDNTTIPVKRCTKCGEEKPATPEYFYRMQGALRPNCKPCHKQYLAEYRNRDGGQEDAAKRSKLWREQNPERAAAISKSRNPEKHKATKKAWNTRNMDKRREYSRRSRRKNAATSRAAYHRYQARKRGLPNTLTAAEWRMALEYFGGRCAICGRTPAAKLKITPDHWIALSKDTSPGTIAANIVPLCWGINGCNNSKSNRNPLQWLNDRFGAAKAAAIVQRIDAYFEWLKAHA